MVVKAASPNTTQRKRPSAAAKQDPIIVLDNASGKVRRRNAEIQFLIIERELTTKCTKKYFVKAAVLGDLVVVFYGIFGYLEKSGLRFSKKAFLPSCASSGM